MKNSVMAPNQSQILIFIDNLALPRRVLQKAKEKSDYCQLFFLENSKSFEGNELRNVIKKGWQFENAYAQKIVYVVAYNRITGIAGSLKHDMALVKARIAKDGDNIELLKQQKDLEEIDEITLLEDESIQYILPKEFKELKSPILVEMLKSFEEDFLDEEDFPGHEMLESADKLSTHRNTFAYRRFLEPQPINL